MIKNIKSMAVSALGVLTIMLYIGCTPGKAQTRANDYKGNFGTEEYEAFDTGDNTGEDVIPGYGNNSPKGQSYNGSSVNNSNAHTGKNGVQANGNNQGSQNGIYRADSAYDNRRNGQGFQENRNRVSPNPVYVQNNVNAEQYRANRFYQKGYASWYGREFHGRKTASGERFDMNNFTAAHKTLPFGTILEVKNLKNGKVVRVKVNDRGPYRGNRIIDLSYIAARQLKMVGTGTIPVGINVIKLGKNRTARGNQNRYVEPVSDREINNSYDNAGDYSTDSDDSSFVLQAGAFYSRNNAEKLKARIEMSVDRPVRIVRDGDFFKVRVEGMRHSFEAQRVKDTLRGDGIASFVIK